MENILMGLVEWGVFTFIIGFLVVFLGVIVIIFFISIAGKFNSKIEEKKNTNVEPTKQSESIEQTAEESDEIPVHIRLAIISAISAYYMGESSKNSFRVKQIKRK